MTSKFAEQAEELATKYADEFPWESSLKKNIRMNAYEVGFIAGAEHGYGLAKSEPIDVPDSEFKPENMMIALDIFDKVKAEREELKERLIETKRDHRRDMEELVRCHQIELAKLKAEVARVVKKYEDDAHTWEARASRLMTERDALKEQVGELRQQIGGYGMGLQEENAALKAEVEELRWFRDEVNKRVIPGQSDTHDAAREFINGLGHWNRKLEEQLATERERSARLVEAAKDWLDDTEEECSHHPEWQALSAALLDAKQDDRSTAVTDEGNG